MTRKLNNADRAAVDLMFDRIATTNASNGKDNMLALSGTVMTSAVPEANIQAVEKVLNLLSQMPAHEPPADLATRTLQRIARTTGSAPQIPASLLNPDQPTV